MSAVHFAQTTDFAFVEELLTFGEDYPPQPGDVIEFDGLTTTSGEPFPGTRATVLAKGQEMLLLREEESGQELEVVTDGWFHIAESPTITATWEAHLRRSAPDGVAFADGLVDGALVERLRADVQQLLDHEPIDYHPGSGTKVRDLVHPSLFPYIEGRSVLQQPAPPPATPSHDRFGRIFEASRYQWLPTPFQVAADGKVLAATTPQLAGALDDRYAAAAAPAAPPLGATIAQGRTRFALWAPTAERAWVCLHDTPEGPSRRLLPLQRDAATGIWQGGLTGDRSGTSYTYLVDVFVRGTGWVRNRVTDPYSLSLTADSQRSVVLNLDDPTLKPLDWDTTPTPNTVQAPTDLVIYELHVRDF